MKNVIQPIKATILGGVLFLVPVTAAVIIVAKVFEFMSTLAAPFSEWIPVESIGGIATANIITTLIVLAICFIAGIVTTSVLGRRVREFLDEKLLLVFPRYTFVKSMAESISADEAQKTLQPVRIKFDDHCQIGFELERDDAGLVTVYLPGAPDPWSGSVVHVTDDRIVLLDAKFGSVVKSLQRAGRGANALLR